MKAQVIVTTLVLAFVAIDASGQSINRIQVRIDSICLSINNNMGLHEGISEGPIQKKKGKAIGGFETRDLKDDEKLFRIKYVVSIDLTETTTYYYDQKNLIKAALTKERWKKDHLEVVHSAKYYFANNSLVLAEGETKEFGNVVQILEEGQKFLSEFYADKK